MAKHPLHRRLQRCQFDVVPVISTLGGPLVQNVTYESNNT